MRDLVAALPRSGLSGQLGALERALLTLDTDLRVAEAADLTAPRVTDLRNRLAQVFDLLSRQYFR